MNLPSETTNQKLSPVVQAGCGVVRTPIPPAANPKCKFISRVSAEETSTQLLCSAIGRLRSCHGSHQPQQHPTSPASREAACGHHAEKPYPRLCPRNRDSGLPRMWLLSRDMPVARASLVYELTLFLLFTISSFPSPYLPRNSPREIQMD